MLDRIRNGLARIIAAPPQVKASAAGPAISVARVGQPVWTERDYDSFAEEAYVRNAVAFRCIKMISRSAATIPWLLDDGRGNAIEKHPILDILRRPAANIGGNTLFEAFYAYLLIAGNSYLEAVGPDRKPPRELWALRPDRMKVVAGRFGMPQGFEYEANGQTIRWEADPLTGAGPILHLKEFHPRSDWYGLSPVEPASYSIDRHNAAVAHNTALIQNGASPSGALVFKPVTVPGGGVVSAPMEVITAAETRMNERHMGAANAGRPFILGGDVSWEQMGLSPKDMDFNESKMDAARDICLAFGVPHILIVPGQSTYNNLREAKLELYEETILPLVDKGLDALNAWLVPMFGGNLVLGVDKDEIPALSLRRELKQKATLELFDKKLLTRDEARAALDYDTLGAADADKLDAPEKAEVGLKKAQTVKAYADSGLIGDEALGAGVTAMLVADDTYPGLAAAVAKFGPPADDAGDDDVDPDDPGAKSIESKAAPRTLYVSRKLLNGAEFLAWAKGQGFTKTLAASDLHVTIAFSRAKLDWMKIGDTWGGNDGKLTVAPGGARLVEPLGDKGAVVLLFNSAELSWRNMAIREAGASWDYPEYQPHVSITYDGSGVDLSTVKPYRGKLEFGPEIFAELDEDWKPKPGA